MSVESQILEGMKEMDLGEKWYEMCVHTIITSILALIKPPSSAPKNQITIAQAFTSNKPVYSPFHLALFFINFCDLSNVI